MTDLLFVSVGNLLHINYLQQWAGDVLEHISFKDSEDFIEKMYNKLKSGGILRISVPSFDSIIQIY